MQPGLSELRLDIPLPAGADAHGFERGWRETLAAQKLTALAAPPAPPFPPASACVAWEQSRSGCRPGTAI